MRGIEKGMLALKKTRPRNQDLIDRLIPLTQRLAEIMGKEGITVTNIRHHGLRLGILTENDALDFLPHVPQQAGLVNRGQYRRSKLGVTHGNLQLVWYPPSIRA